MCTKGGYERQPWCVELKLQGDAWKEGTTVASTNGADEHVRARRLSAGAGLVQDKRVIQVAGSVHGEGTRLEPLVSKVATGDGVLMRGSWRVVG